MICGPFLLFFSFLLQSPKLVLSLPLLLFYLCPSMKSWVVIFEDSDSLWDSSIPFTNYSLHFLTSLRLFSRLLAEPQSHFFMPYCFFDKAIFSPHFLFLPHFVYKSIKFHSCLTWCISLFHDVTPFNICYSFVCFSLINEF